MAPTITRKRKSQQSSLLSRKKPRKEVKSLNQLPWKSVKRSFESGANSDDGILDFEEVDDVEVIYEETEAGRVVKFHIPQEAVSDDDEESVEAPNKTSLLEDNQSDKATKTHVNDQDVTPEEPFQFDVKSLLPAWASFDMNPLLLSALHNMRFNLPTPIQSRSLPLCLTGRDVIGVAETGSGKTLAYGLPILHRLLGDAPARRSSSHRPVQALILAPTRELALQVSQHLNSCLSAMGNAPTNVKTEDEDVGMPDGGKESKKGKREKASSTAPKQPAQPNAPPLVSVASIVGGMSLQKQKRILDRGVDILVATPGRLWDILEEDVQLAREIRHLKFLVLDEADRMIETGHFAELDNIIRLTLRQSEEDEIEPENKALESESGDDINKDAETPVSESTNLQTFVFSATLSKDLQKNLRRPSRSKARSKKHEKPASTLDDLLLRLDFRDPEPAVVDISPEGGVVSTLQESKIDCLSTDKDAYLYYFLLRYPGRSLVFLASIDGIRRLVPLLELLELKVFPLHSQMEQRQRLKNLDRFKTTPNSVLIATDIAARGLDIPSVDHVIHYQIPRSADAYVHRNGRTARAQRKGFSMLMCAPDERRIVKALMGSLNRKDSEIPEMSIDLNILDKLKARIQLAKQIDNARHKVKKMNHEKHWMKEIADAMDIEVDSDYLSDSDDEDRPSNAKRKAKNVQTENLKAQLNEMLAQPVLVRGMSTRYITSGSHIIVDDLISGNYNDAMLGVKKEEAGSHLVSAKKKKQIKAEPKTEDTEKNLLADSTKS